jgi:hypothetical protein
MNNSRESNNNKPRKEIIMNIPNTNNQVRVTWHKTTKTQAQT